MCYLQENNINKVIWQGCAGCLCDAKVSHFFKGKKKINCLKREFTAYLFVVEWISIYKGKQWLLSLLDGDTISPPLGEEFPFPSHGPIVKG